MATDVCAEQCFALALVLVWENAEQKLCKTLTKVGLLQCSTRGLGFFFGLGTLKKKHIMALCVACILVWGMLLFHFWMHDILWFIFQLRTLCSASPWNFVCHQVSSWSLSAKCDPAFLPGGKFFVPVTQHPCAHVDTNLDFGGGTVLSHDGTLRVACILKVRLAALISTSIHICWGGLRWKLN